MKHYIISKSIRPRYKINSREKIKRLIFDRGGEYFSNDFSEFCAEHGIIHERTPPYSPQSNGIAERKNRTLIELVSAMLDTAGLSKEWWGETILTACHVLNRVPMLNKEVTPFEEWEKRRLNLSYLRTWGCLAKVNVTINKKRKIVSFSAMPFTVWAIVFYLLIPKCLIWWKEQSWNQEMLHSLKMNFP
jgi:transposase InsO family protein